MILLSSTQSLKQGCPSSGAWSRSERGLGSYFLLLDLDLACSFLGLVGLGIGALGMGDSDIHERHATGALLCLEVSEGLALARVWGGGA